MVGDVRPGPELLHALHACIVLSRVYESEEGVEKAEGLGGSGGPFLWPRVFCARKNGRGTNIMSGALHENRLRRKCEKAEAENG